MTDRSKPPPGYVVWNAAPHSGWCAGTTMQEVHRTEDEAVVECRRHHGRIAARALREAANALEEHQHIDRWWEAARFLRARADELDPEKQP